MTVPIARRLLVVSLLALAALALCAAPASAFRRISHPDPAKAFKKHKRHGKARISAFSSSFAGDWPCAASATDRPSGISGNAPQVKVVYAYPTDTGDAFDSYKNLIQLDAKTV